MVATSEMSRRAIVLPRNGAWGLFRDRSGSEAISLLAWSRAKSIRLCQYLLFLISRLRMESNVLYACRTRSSGRSELTAQPSLLIALVIDSTRSRMKLSISAIVATDALPSNSAIVSSVVLAASARVKIPLQPSSRSPASAARISGSSLILDAF